MAGFLTTGNAAGFFTTGFLTAGFLEAGFLTAGFLTAGFLITFFAGARVLVAAFFIAFLSTGFFAAFLGDAMLPPENIAGHTAGCCGCLRAVATPPVGTCHADAVET